ncbi:hypothetical protein [Vibrio fluvialis]|uniref:hypothetical protein n=1 Tax=Vibrio fluvialis TaxID=676 RepID=UPI001F44A883|nr:hypothetical protein [Vibrio fluvialis]MCE7646899.1 hypothetical protein [Vibrio fluvialis]
MKFIDSIPTLLSAIASIAAAVAAFISLRISKQSQSVSELNVLATHHASATIAYVEVVKELSEVSKDFKEIGYQMWLKWAQEIESYDNYSLGGVNPRPLRHVLSNGSEMMTNYALNTTRWGYSTNRAILSIIRFGMSNFSDTEYEELLEKADGKYLDFEDIFGPPKFNEQIGESSAFRWVCYQLKKRVSYDDWRLIWYKAWKKDNWFDRYGTEYFKIKPVFENAKKRLEDERAKLSPSSFPLSYNITLNYKYEQLLKIINHILEDSDINNIYPYKDWEFKEEFSQLVLCSMANSYCLYRRLDNLYILAND